MRETLSVVLVNVLSEPKYQFNTRVLSTKTKLSEDWLALHRDITTSLRNPIEESYAKSSPRRDEKSERPK